MALTVPFVLFRPDTMQLPANTPPEVVEAINLKSSEQITKDEFNQRMIQSGFIQNVFLPKILVHSALNFVVVGVIFIFCWYKWQATPGKMLLGLRIVDEKTMKNPKAGQHVVRYIGYFISTILLFGGFLMIGLNKKKKGLHDIMAGTVVIHGRPYSEEWENKKKKWRVYATIAIILIGAIYLSGKL
jgi:uncharacterized RDD family membrane protein YckC